MKVFIEKLISSVLAFFTSATLIVTLINLIFGLMDNYGPEIYVSNLSYITMAILSVLHIIVLQLNSNKNSNA